jgi:putative endonuclease
MLDMFAVALQDYSLASQRDGELFYVYILVSEADATQHYTGITQDLPSKRAIQDTCICTTRCRPWRIETAIAFRSEAKARAFEKYLKAGSGREFSRRHL